MKTKNSGREIEVKKKKNTKSEQINKIHTWFSCFIIIIMFPLNVSISPFAYE